ncbi:hypothetical protein IAI53_12160 [Thauera sp. CAU 1555]|uniref:Type IV pilus biogenesis protein PilP n=1 Tax=Thauera sedimentorum TaxID=2767595 RepID=A0ABR9BBF0_9RHOO|nr:hypothetical protein [Thauera sedimentorum]MBC9072721.1 hypothetical protein [Thauera sedimentorum]MBD8503640.1 hypothetical protein [Thauera sedimentorum]
MKHLPLAALLVLGAATLGGLWLGSGASAYGVPASAGTDSDGALARVDAELARVQRLQAQIEPLAATLNRHTLPISNLVATAARPGDKAADAAQQDGEALISLPEGPVERNLNLVYASDGFYRAVIDGHYVRKGDLLPDGGRVTAIGRGGVVVHDSFGRHELAVPDPRPPKTPLSGGMK